MKNNRLIYLGVSAFLLPLLILVIPWYPWQLIVGLSLIAFLPGYALLKALWPQSNHLTPPEQWLTAVPVSYSLTITLLLVMAFARLPLTAFSVAWGLGGVTLLFTFWAWRHQNFTSSRSSHPSPYYPPSTLYPLASILILLLAAFFRITNIHYSDYQGDEADILLRAVSLVYGQVDAILTHSKGPGEILLLNAIGALTGRFDEQTTRLPFALAGTMSVGFIMLLGQVLFNRWIGLAAGLLVAIDGVFVSYARTAQYQSVVLLLTLAAIYAYYRFQQGGDLSRRWHGLATFLLVGSFLLHFETVLLLPVVVYLTFAAETRGNKDAERRGREESKNSLPFLRLIASRLTYHASRITPHVSHLWPSVLIFIVPVALFYMPFLLNPNLESTGTYLENRISGGSSPPFNNLAHFFYYEALKYNSAYYVVFFNALLLLVVGSQSRPPLRVRQWAGVAERRFYFYLIASLLLLSGAAFWLLNQTQISAWLLAVGTALLFGWIIFLPQTPLPQRVLCLWLAPPFWVYVFWVSRPGKHHYLFLGALALWVSWVVVQGWQRATAVWPKLSQPVGRWLGVGLAGVVLVVFAGHTFMLFLRSDLEYVLTYPDHKSSFYPTDTAYPYGTRIGFGYPFRLGWQLVGQLRRTGRLEGSWAGNDDGNAPIWYMLGAHSTPCYPHYVLQGEITYKGDDDFKVPFDPANFGYAPRYRIWGDNRLRLTVLEFQPLVPVEPVDLIEPASFEPPVTAADFAPAMTAQPAPPQVVLQPALVLGEGSELKNNAPPEYLARAEQLNGRVALLGYDVAEEYAQPGSMVPITLHWQAQSLLSLRYKVFVHLIGPDNQNWSQADDFPVCGTSHANSWGSGELILDRHLLKLPPDLPPGSYTLLVGMYEPDLNLRLNYFDVAGNEQGNSLDVGTLKVKG